MNKTIVILTLLFFLSASGCNVATFVMSPSAYEKKVEAQYDLKEKQDEKILIFVDDSRTAGAGSDFIADLKESIRLYLIDKVKINKKYLVDIDTVITPLQRRTASYKSATPAQLGKIAGTGLVLYVYITDYELFPAGYQKYYSGAVTVRSALFDTDSGNIVWPVTQTPRQTRAKVELETEGANITKARLIKTVSHCITRSFYDIPRPLYKTADEAIGYEEAKW